MFAGAESVLNVRDNEHDCLVFIWRVVCYCPLPLTWTEPRILITFQTAVFIHKKPLNETVIRAVPQGHIHVSLHGAASQYGAKGRNRVGIWKQLDAIKLNSVENILRKLLHFVKLFFTEDINPSPYLCQLYMQNYNDDDDDDDDNENIRLTHF
jgi:hypothetical protein